MSQIPLNFYVNDLSAEYLSEATIKGFIDVESNTAIPQSSMISINESSLFSDKKSNRLAY